MPRSFFAGAVALVLILATGSAMARLSGPLLGIDLVKLAREQIGNGAIYGRQKLWCARFVNWLLEHAGYRGTRSDAAKSFLHFPHTFARVGAIAVLWRKGGGGHVGIVSGFDHAGNPVLISGNHGHRVYEATYPRSRVLAYVLAATSNVAPDKAPNTIADFEPDDAAHRQIIDSVRKRIIEVPPARVRQRVVSNSGQAEITPGTASNTVSRTAMLQGRASRGDPPAGQERKSEEWKSEEWKSEEWKGEEWKGEEWKSQEWKSQEQNSWEQKSSEWNSGERNSWEQKTQEKGKEQKGQEQKGQGQKGQEQKGQEQKSQEQKSWEQNSWERNSWEQKTQEKGKEQKGQGQKSHEQNSWEQGSWEQNSWELNSWEKDQEKGKEQKGQEQNSSDEKSHEQKSQSTKSLRSSPLRGAVSRMAGNKPKD
jgi:uncharacterized protein (TIGR02594 family)